MSRPTLLGRQLALTGFALVVPALLMLQHHPATTSVDLAQRFLRPGQGHWFGTDELGRDLFLRTLAGAGYTAAIVLVSLAAASTLGIGLGIAAGMSNRRLARASLDQVVNIVWSVPGLVLFVASTTYFGRGFSVIAVTLSAAAWAPIARVVQAEVAREKGKDYVTALRGFGFGRRSVVCAVFANVLTPTYVVVVTVALDLVAAESALSFLGLGVQPPAPSLGGMVYSGLLYLSVGWWMLIVPLCTLLLLIRVLRNLLPRRRLA
jgi:ABC-type dipeptide/oligopeptide/nickel transport system permease subunit